MGVVTELLTPEPYFPTGKVHPIYLFNIHYSCGVEVGVDLTPIWEELERRKEKMDGLVTLNKDLLRGIYIFQSIFGRRNNLSDYLPILRLANNE